MAPLPYTFTYKPRAHVDEFIQQGSIRLQGGC